MPKEKLVHGIGVNDAGYPVTFTYLGKRKHCAAYGAWKHMLERCYSERWLARNPSYRGVAVASEWQLFSNFSVWFHQHYVDGWHLDKDILSDSRVYSPSTCVFIPEWLNKFVIDSGANRGLYPVGVSRNERSGAFVARCRVGGNAVCLGSFSSPKDAHLAWQKHKLGIALARKTEMDAVDSRVYPRVVEIICRHAEGLV